MTDDVKKEKTYAEVINETKIKVKETITENFAREKEQAKNELNHVMQKLNQVEEKNRCFRVRTLDWLSDTFHHWGDLCHRKSVKIDSLCVIRMPESNTDDIRLTNPRSWVSPEITSKDKVESKKRK